jgi:biopolymer transport protein ExbD
MRRVRRMSGDVHVELTPMIDVVFLLLTFFVFAIVLMVRADVLDVNLPELSSGRNADAVAPITIAITESGELLVNREAVGLDGVVEKVQAIKNELGDGPLVLAVDTKSQAGILIALADRLTGAGLGEFSIIGHKAAPATTDIDASDTESSLPAETP